MKTHSATLARATLLALLTGLAPSLHSQTTDRSKPSRNSTPGENSGMSGPGQTQTQETTRRDAATAGHSALGAPGRYDWKNSTRVSDLRGRDVNNAQGEKLGTISDVLVDTHSGRAAYVVVQFGGMIGIGQRMRAVPIGALNQANAAADQPFILDLDRARWDAAPVLEKARLSELQSDDQGASLHRYYGQTWRADDRDLSDRTGMNTGMGLGETNRPQTKPGENPDYNSQRATTDTTTSSRTTSSGGTASANRPADQTTANRATGTTSNTTASNSMSSTTPSRTTDTRSTDASTSTQTTSTGMAGTDRDRTASPGALGTPGAGQMRQLAFASDIEDKKLHSGGREIGTIDEIVVNVENRQAAALVDPTGDFSDAKGKFLLSFTRLQKAGDDRYTTTLVREDFDRSQSGTSGSTTRSIESDGVIGWSEADRRTE